MLECFHSLVCCWQEVLKAYGHTAVDGDESSDDGAGVEQVQAHGGGMLPWGGRFYWVGEGAKPGCTPGDFGQGCNPIELELSQDINLYSSADLASWTFEGSLLNQVPKPNYYSF